MLLVPELVAVGDLLAPRKLRKSNRTDKLWKGNKKLSSQFKFGESNLISDFVNFELGTIGLHD